MQKKHWIFAIAAALIICLSGCAVKTEGENAKIKNLEFTIIGEDKLPEELKQIVEEKKENEFKITYQDGDFLYICVGYGRQESGGYSITVNNVYLTGNSVYVDTNLIGPDAQNRELYHAQEGKSLSYPYIVIKMEYLDKSIVFD